MMQCKDCMYFKRCVVLGEELDMKHDKEAEKNCRHFIKKTGEWISVKNKLPKLDTEVIVATKSKVFSAMRIRKIRNFKNEIFWSNAVWGFEPMENYTGKVLYWMPLPEPPEHKSKGE